MQELVFSHHGTIEELIDKYFADDYVHRFNGTVHTRAEFAAMAKAARAQIVKGTVTTLEEFCAGDCYAERHLLDVTSTDGSTERTEVYVIGRYSDDGRFARINEAAVRLSSS
ncbi:nuclear transport factor 2 family protein [Mycobacterium terramassiliense]|uniref:nuclear transport factor 2 family protein n=1 Tax=Mycobacterium terramassiliense TaxID=1841859 RepID=UPI0012FFA681|nr:nuclear transport factor 2 family protein [Mycobacterium terramassiliense]